VKTYNNLKQGQPKEKNKNHETNIFFFSRTNTSDTNTHQLENVHASMMGITAEGNFHIISRINEILRTYHKYLIMKRNEKCRWTIFNDFRCIVSILNTKFLARKKPLVSNKLGWARNETQSKITEIIDLVSILNNTKKQVRLEIK
jgi:hypothetical protein